MRSFGRHPKIISATALVMACTRSAAAQVPCARLAGTGAAAGTAAAQTDTVLFRRVGPAELDDTKPFRFVVDGASYVVTRAGELRRTAARAAGAAVRLPSSIAGATVAAVWAEAFRGDLLIAYEMTDQEESATELMRFASGSLVRRWRRTLPGFNFGPALVRGDTAYLTVVGSVTKLDLRTGRALWQRDGLYDRRAHFDAFDAPRVRGAMLVLPSAVDGVPGAPMDTLRMSAATGRVLSTFIGARGGGRETH